MTTAMRKPPTSSLDLPATELSGVGRESAKLLDKLGIRTIGDLLWHLPRTYLDFSKFTPLRHVRAEQEQTVEAILGRISQRRTSTGKLMTEVELVDPADRTPTNIRLYSENDIRRILWIRHLTRERGVNLAGIRILFELEERLGARILESLYAEGMEDAATETRETTPDPV